MGLKMKRESAGRILKPSLRLRKNSYEDRKGNPRDRESNNKFEKKKDIGFSFYVLLLLGFFLLLLLLFIPFPFHRGIRQLFGYTTVQRCRHTQIEINSEKRNGIFHTMNFVGKKTNAARTEYGSQKLN